MRMFLGMALTAVLIVGVIASVVAVSYRTGNNHIRNATQRLFTTPNQNLVSK